MIVGIGVDVVDVPRFEETLARTPGMLERLFTESERRITAPRSLAARFAAKEAVAKALGAPPGLAWHDVEVVTSEAGAPELVLTGTVLARAEQLGGRSWHVSLTHDAGIATAFVVVES